MNKGARIFLGLASSYNAGQAYDIQIASIANNSVYTGTNVPAPYTFNIKLSLRNGSTDLITPITQSVSFAATEEKSVNRGDPVTFHVTMPTGIANPVLYVQLFDTNGTAIAYQGASIQIVQPGPTTGTLVFNGVVPTGAIIYLYANAGYPAGSSNPVNVGQVYTLYPGTFQFDVASPGYTVITGTAVIVAGQRTTIPTITLQTSPGSSYAIAELNPFNATVLVNGSPITQGTVYKVNPGTYSYTASASGYVSQSGTFVVTQGNETVLNIILQQQGAATGTVVFNSHPVLATVTWNGNQVSLGTVYTAPPGTYSYTASYPGYQTYTASFTVIAGQNINVNVWMNSV
jgi:hypothetical protein